MISQRFRIGADVDNPWQTVQPGPISEKQAQWLRLQFCPVTVGVTEWIGCSRLSHLFKQLAGDPLAPGPVPDPERGVRGKEEEDDDDDDFDDDDNDDDYYECGGVRTKMVAGAKKFTRLDE